MEQVRPQPAAQAPGRRKSVFMEVGLVDEAQLRRERSPAPILIANPSPKRLRPTRVVRFRSQHDVIGQKEENQLEENDEWESASDADDIDYNTLASRRSYASQPVFGSKLYRVGLFALVLAFMLPVLQSSPLSAVGAKGGVIPRATIDPYIAKREDTNTNICKRWSHQCKRNW